MKRTPIGRVRIVSIILSLFYGLNCKNYEGKLHTEVGSSTGSQIQQAFLTTDEVEIITATLSGWWNHLLNFNVHRLSPETDNVCPLCGDSPHDTRHIFKCWANPTIIGAETLWAKPKKISSIFLRKNGWLDERASDFYLVSFLLRVYKQLSNVTIQKGSYQSILFVKHSMTPF